MMPEHISSEVSVNPEAEALNAGPRLSLASRALPLSINPFHTRVTGTEEDPCVGTVPCRLFITVPPSFFRSI
jgi:hypothetical protein